MSRGVTDVRMTDSTGPEDDETRRLSRPPETTFGSGLISIKDYSRSILRSPCVGVHHSTTSFVASTLRWVCTTSVMSA